MQNLEEFKNNWTKTKAQVSDAGSLDKTSWQKIVHQRANKQKDISMKYFWASFTFQIIVYSLLAHVIVKYGQDTPILIIGIFCLLLYVPFTIMLMRKFKRMAILKSEEMHGLPIKEYIQQHYSLLSTFYSFKKRYEIILVPLSSAILTWVFFRIYLPGGVLAYPNASLVLFILTLGSCVVAIVAENRKRFKKPLAHLKGILGEMNQ